MKVALEKSSITKLPMLELKLRTSISLTLKRSKSVRAHALTFFSQNVTAIVTLQVCGAPKLRLMLSFFPGPDFHLSAFISNCCFYWMS